jgi:translation elongation factor EF-1alpha
MNSCSWLPHPAGHVDYVQNTITGAYGAPFGVLVVAAGTGEFEAGMSAHGGRTREHALIAFTQGCRHLIVHPVCKLLDVQIKYVTDCLIPGGHQ